MPRRGRAAASRGAPAPVQFAGRVVPAAAPRVEGYPARALGYGRGRACRLRRDGGRRVAARGARRTRRDGFRARTRGGVRVPLGARARIDLCPPHGVRRGGRPE